jgi:hypothetical protein
MARAWTPRPVAAAQLLRLDLSAREGYVLSRIDGATDVDELGLVTGLSSAEVREVLERLVREGAIEPHEASSVVAHPSGGTAATGEAAEAADLEALEATRRQLFETRLHALSEDERARLAATAEEPDLSALCFDPVPAVIHRVLENPRTGLVQARLIAAHHRNPVGLEALAARPAFLADREVQRHLLRNVQSSEAMVRRLLASRRLLQIYECCQSHEIAEPHRKTARSVLKTRFSAGSPDERVELILITEGRVLGTLAGLALDGRSVALICGRGIRSTLLAENLARWPATPPDLIAYLLKHPLVRQVPSLKLLLNRHPNRPRSPP